MNNLYDIAFKAALEAGQAIVAVYDSDDFGVTEKDDNSPLTKADRAAHKVIISYLEKTSVPILSEEGRNIPFEERSDWDTFWLVDPLDGTKEFIKRNGEFTVNIALIKTGSPVFGVVYAPVLENLYTGIAGEGAWLINDPERDITVDILKKSGSSLPLPSSYDVHNRTNTYRVVASRSHLNTDTQWYLDQIKAVKGEIEIVSKGSSLKLCMVATGEADVYPRLAPTMEWDVAAAHAVVSGSGKKVFRLVKSNTMEDGEWEKSGELHYNKEDLLNPYFLVE